MLPWRTVSFGLPTQWNNNQIEDASYTVNIKMVYCLWNSHENNTPIKFNSFTFYIVNGDVCKQHFTNI